MNESRYRELMAGFIRCLGEGSYFEAHTMLEEIWFPRRFEGSDEIKLLRGFINASVSFELRRRGRFEAAARVWKTYLKYLPILARIESGYCAGYREMAAAIETVKAAE